MRFEDHPAEYWTPVRYMQHDAVCDFCRFKIPRGSPGRSRGTRGTRCWWNAFRKVYECLDCRTEAVRADIARHAQRDAKRAQGAA